MFKRNVAVAGFQIGHFIGTADGVPVTTGTPACKRLLDGTPGTLTNAAAYDTTAGVWKIDLAAGDMDAGLVGLSFTLAACLPISYTIKTGTKLVSDLNDAAAAPNAAAIGAEIWEGEYTREINSVSSTISANVVQMNGDTDPVDNLVLALGTGGLVEKLNSMLEAAGLAYRFTAAALAEAPTEAGSGTGTYTDTIKDPSNNPLDGARVQLSTDAAGTHRVYEAFTNALGVFTMNPDPGTYYRWIDLAGYTDRLTQGAQVTVT